MHLQHGPIDLIIGADGARGVAFEAAQARLTTVLSELMEELPLLRLPVDRTPKGRIAQRMYRAALPFADGLTTPMISVAGSVAQEVLAAMTRATPLRRAYVNNGGDIALHLAGEATFKIGMAGPAGDGLGSVEITAGDPVRGIATSGQQGRSLSLGIADSVTVLAASASMADAAATQIANAVDLPGHPCIRRVPAHDVKDDTDLGAAPVVAHVGPLTYAETDAALAAGQRRAEVLQKAGLIHAAALFLRDQSRTLGQNALIQTKEIAHA
jgi:ApbE superfamily uncharacterized protein (UPF0280 family)